jgi:RND superfamily putative drug exporter
MLEADRGTEQMGFAMATGILLASLVVSRLLVRGPTALLGRRAWWTPRRHTAPVEREPARA